MIVQCPSCSSRYRVNDANIPPTGGKIRCPSCAHAFVVYPEAPAMDAEDKTSVAQRPNLQELVKGMQAQSAAQGQDEVAKTEVMSGAELPDFSSLFGGNPPDGEQTVEMSNPIFQQAAQAMMNAGRAAPNEDDLSTQEVDAGFIKSTMEQVRRQAESAPPIIDDELRTEIAPPEALDQIAPPPMHQQRISAPSGPTPPPSSTNFGIAPMSPPPASPPPMSPPPMSPPPAAPSQPGPAFGSTPAPMEAPPEPAAVGPDTEHPGPWKLETNFGLTYEFADNQSLRNWLDNKDELDGYKLSADGENFYPLDQFPQVKKSPGARSGGNRALASSGAQPQIPGMGPASGPVNPAASTAPPRTSSIPGSPFTTANKAVSGPVPGAAAPDSKEKINPNESFRPPSRDSAALNIILWGAFVLLAVAALALALYVTGVIELPGSDEPAERPAAVERQAPAEEAPEAVAGERDDAALEQQRQRNREEATRIIASAQEDMDSNRLGSALETLKRAQVLDPERIQIYDMKAEVHEKLGQAEDAEAMRSRARELRAQGSAHGTD